MTPKRTLTVTAVPTATAERCATYQTFTQALVPVLCEISRQLIARQELYIDAHGVVRVHHNVACHNMASPREVQ